MKSLLLILLLPAVISAQEVRPVFSDDYLALIHKDSSGRTKHFRIDTLNSIKNSPLRFLDQYYGYAIREIRIRDGRLQVRPATSKILLLTGEYSIHAEAKLLNRIPKVQSVYAQGRSINGVAAWRGPDMDEPFSYGPPLSALEFDGTSYSYDVNGRLVPVGSGNGKGVHPYSNELLRNGSLLSQAISLHAKYMVAGQPMLSGSLRYNRSSERTILPQNTNRSGDFYAAFATQFKKLSITTRYQLFNDRYSKPGRNGYLNRLYANSLLTPASFDNDQGYLIGSLQRRYSSVADHPGYLLNSPGNGYNEKHETGSIVFEAKLDKARFSVLQSVENRRQSSAESYPIGSAFFPSGRSTIRSQHDAAYFLKLNGRYNVEYSHGRTSSYLNVNYIFSAEKTAIGYAAARNFTYNRRSHDAALSYFTKISSGRFEGALNLENKLYGSNTSAKNRFFLPGFSGHVQADEIFAIPDLGLKISGSHSRFLSEKPLSQSYSYLGLLRHTTADAFSYFPVTEAESYDQLLPARNKEWRGAVEWNYKRKISLKAEVFNRKVQDDLFPVVSNGVISLTNGFDHSDKGIELEFSINTYHKDLISSHAISFNRTRSLVTSIKEGHNYSPTAGFADVHKALVTGEFTGTIVGSSYLRDANNRMIIGTDGFPLVNPEKKRIGNTTPDFVLKTSHGIQWKNFHVSLDAEWKKGGDIWNGTSAILDYYGRSENTARLRETKNYIFNGVTETGHSNSIPVNFYDPSLPVEQNRWTRYGPGGIAEEYIQKGDHIRINNLSLSYKLKSRKYIQSVIVGLVANNLILWTAYNGADPNQLLFGQQEGAGLDFFNLPSTKNFGCSITIQF